MQSDRELMQQALEALQQAQRYGAGEWSTLTDALRKHLVQQAPRPDYRDWDYQDQLEQSPLDRMAENARELGLDYEPVQEPVAMRYDFDGYGYRYIDSGSGSNWQTRIKDAEPLYAAPPQPDTKVNFEAIPKQISEQEPVAWMVKAHGTVQRIVVRADVADELACQWRESDSEADLYPLYTTPPRCPNCASLEAQNTELDAKLARREWQELTDDERSYYLQTASNIGWWKAAQIIEAKLREKNA